MAISRTGVVSITRRDRLCNLLFKTLRIRPPRQHRPATRIFLAARKSACFPGVVAIAVVRIDAGRYSSR